MNKAPLKRHNVNVMGSGEQPILFAHGLGCDQQVWRSVSPAFLENYKVVLFDYIGSGRSDISGYSKEKYASLNGYATDIIEIIEALKMRGIVFVGHSVSSIIGMLAAIKRPELFSKLVMIGPSPYYLKDGHYNGGFEKSEIDAILSSIDKDYTGWAKSFAPVFMGKQDNPAFSKLLEDRMCHSDPIITRQFAKITFLEDHRQSLPLVKTPVLILQCAEDLIAPPSVGKYINEKITSSKLKLLKATGHCPHISAPGETITAIREFLTEQ